MKISIAIQHHPRRAEILHDLISALTPLSVQVVRDPEPNSRMPSSWRTNRLALETTPAWATHRLVIQDDTRPCRSFPAVLERAIAARPDRVLVLCACGRPAVTARRSRIAFGLGEAWVPLFRNQWVPTLALVWPARLIRPALRHVDSQAWPERFTADDEIIARTLTRLREPVLVAVPSIVQHDDLVPSLLGARHKAKLGKDEGRVAALFADDVVKDPLLIDWEAGPA